MQRHGSGKGGKASPGASKVQHGKHGHSNVQALRTKVSREAGYKSMVDMHHSADVVHRGSHDNPYQMRDRTHGAGNDTVKNHA